jgi:hypothetical protein
MVRSALCNVARKQHKSVKELAIEIVKGASTRLAHI